ncbi:MAG: methyl-accepting chemotaxis protein [Caldilineaceae bacterium]|nr:methyl-accepting chemotaxis protein [Caldilineaceae bacterium]MBP8125240.1 methyl-accepting chemotaxis protein [Caldilineaceae bacterium]MBP9072300.1 methyl-accepting chemotaxis protein [Caldilineaceae bacterium]
MKRVFRITLQVKLIGAFVLATFFVMGFGYVGYSSVNKLAVQLNEMGQVFLPSAQSLLTVIDAQDQMMTIERTLIDNTLTPAARSTLAQTDLDQRQIAEDAWTNFINLPQTAELSRLVARAEDIQPQWFTEHQAIVDLSQRFIETGDQTILADMRARSLTQSGALRSELNRLFQQMAVLNAGVAQDGRVQAQATVDRARTLTLGGMIAGSLLALIIGTTLSMAIARPISRSTSSIAAVSSQLAATVAEQERTIAQQSAAINQTATTMTELNTSARQSAQQADVVAARSNKALDLAHDGVTVIQHTQHDMINLRSKVNAIAQQILRLSEQTSQISGITNLVSDLANQTNMLALNAAVEAARAGEHGKGFAVVAMEVRKLADQSKKSAERIIGLVGEIQSATNATVMVTEEGSKTVDKGIASAEDAVTMFNDIATTMANVSESTQQISLNSQQQANAIQQVSQGLSELNIGMMETTQAVSQTRVGVQDMNRVVDHLRSLV